MSSQGGCSCGQVRYELVNPALFIHVCHCQDCQRATGSAFLVNMVIDQRDLRVTGDVAQTSLPTGSGAGRDVYRCATCGTQLWSRAHIAPANIVSLRAGTLDDTSAIRSAAHIFTSTMQPWLTLPTGVPAFEAMYDLSAVWPAESLKRLEGIMADN